MTKPFTLEKFLKLTIQTITSLFINTGNIAGFTIFWMPKHNEEVWILFNDILCILPQPNNTKRGKRFDEAVTEVITERFSQWKGKH